MSAHGSLEPWVHLRQRLLNPKGFVKWRTLSGFQGIVLLIPQGSRCARTAGLKLANAFGVKIQTEPAAN